MDVEDKKVVFYQYSKWTGLKISILKKTSIELKHILVIDRFYLYWHELWFHLSAKFQLLNFCIGY